jgi:hypothetical protein
VTGAVAIAACGLAVTVGIGVGCSWQAVSPQKRKQTSPPSSSKGDERI